jgi:phage shock protein B
MNAGEAFVAIIAIMMPVFLVLAFRVKPRTVAGGVAEQSQIQALYETAQRMERRIESLEMLLDTEVPGWRSRSTH